METKGAAIGQTPRADAGKTTQGVAHKKGIDGAIGIATIIKRHTTLPSIH